VRGEDGPGGDGHRVLNGFMRLSKSLHSLSVNHMDKADAGMCLHPIMTITVCQA
jgi:hypothetical protein